MKGAPGPDDFWAKLDQDENGNVIDWHPLAAHSAEVAAVTEALLTRTILGKRLAALVGWNAFSEVHVARLCVLAAIHDAGKVNHGFQNRAFGEKPTAGHVGPIINFLGSGKKEVEMAELIGLRELVPWFGSITNLKDWLRATWGHHGKPVQSKRHVEPAYWTEPAMQGLANMAADARTWFPDAFRDAPAFPEAPEFQHAFNGLLTLADWIGSNRTFFKFAEDLSDPLGQARNQACKIVDRLFLDPSAARETLDAPVGFDGVLPEGEAPYDIQQKALDLPLHEDGSLTVLESDTGSGKTEAAVARFLRLFRAGLVDGMYFAVPTRSAATQLHRRVAEAAEQVFPEGKRPPVVQAVPGYIKTDDTEATRLPDSRDVLWEDDKDDAMKYRGWAAEGPKRYLAGPIVVGTVDQVLMSVLQVKHAHLRATALLRHFLVVDEVHASDVYMTALLDRVLEQHLDAGGHALLMSATLGAAARVHFTAGEGGTLPDPKEAEATPYPSVTHVDARREGAKPEHAASSGRQKTVTVGWEDMASDAKAIAARALEHAEKGAYVLVIRNLVDDCKAVHEKLEDAVGAESDLLFSVNDIAAPHHSRFSPSDRERLDDRIETVFGKKKENGNYDRMAHGVVAVATQTVEQSLDIDADVLITDLCPMDVLLQRIGRLHRHAGRDRPEGYNEKAPCLVVAPQERDLSTAIRLKGEHKGKGTKGKHGLGTVYQDLRMIEAAWGVLEDDTEWQIPLDNRRLVERATHPHCLRAVVPEDEEAWQKHQEFLLGKNYADAFYPNLVGLNRHARFASEPFAESDEKIRTRLGEDDYRAVLHEEMPGPFGGSEAPVEELSIPERWVEIAPDSDEASDVQLLDEDVPAEGFRFTFGEETFQYDRFGLAPESD